jgi:hypothetical protein
MPATGVHAGVFLSPTRGGKPATEAHIVAEQAVDIVASKAMVAKLMSPQVRPKAVLIGRSGAAQATRLGAEETRSCDVSVSKTEMRGPAIATESAVARVGRSLAPVRLPPSADPAAPEAVAANQVWSGRRFRPLNIVDDWSAWRSRSTARCVECEWCAYLEELKQRRGLPRQSRSVRMLRLV